MPIPANLKQVVDETLALYCQRKVPVPVREKVRLFHQWRGSKVTLVEQRPHWKDPAVWGDSPVAQFRFNSDHGDWSLYWRDRNQRWHPYEDHAGSKNIKRLLAEVDEDPTGIFWG